MFWKHGINRFSAKEICSSAKVSKITFYRFFDNKLDLVLTILDLLYEESTAKYNDIMAMDIPFSEKVKRALLSKFKYSQNVSQGFFK